MAYHVLIEGEQKGPYEASSVARMIEHGEIDQATLVWTAGMDDWQPAETVPELATLIGAATTPPPPLTARRPPELTVDEPVTVSEPLVAAGGGRLAIGGTFGRAVAAFSYQPIRALILAFLYLAILGAVNFGVMYAVAGPEILQAGADAQAGPVELPPDKALIIFGVIMVVSIGLLGGMIRVLTEMVHQRPANIAHLFSGIIRIFPLFFGIIFFAVMVSAGFVLLILPGIFLMFSMMLWPFFVVDSRLGPAASLGASYRAVMRLGWWRVFVTLLLTWAMMIGMLFILGFVVSLIGAGAAATISQVMGGGEPLTDFTALWAMIPMMVLMLLIVLVMNLSFGLVMASIYAQAKAGAE
jgi:hypothetical protein